MSYQIFFDTKHCVVDKLIFDSLIIIFNNPSQNSIAFARIIRKLRCRFCTSFVFSVGRFMKRKPIKLERRREIYNLTTVPCWERKSLASSTPVGAHVNAQTDRGAHWIIRRTHYAFAKQLGHRKSYLQRSPLIIYPGSAHAVS